MAVTLQDAAARQTSSGSAVRSDGRSASLTAPNGSAQADLLTVARAWAGTTARDTSGHEAHGTGTALGDPIEIGSLVSAVLRHCSLTSQPVTVGTCKANMGHTEASAGLAGLLNLVRRIDTEASAPNAQLRQINLHVKTALHPSRNTAALPTQTSMQSCSSCMLCGVSSFGYGGTIAHSTLCRSTAWHREVRVVQMYYRRRRFPWSCPQTMQNVTACTAQLAATFTCCWVLDNSRTTTTQQQIHVALQVDCLALAMYPKAEGALGAKSATLPTDSTHTLTVVLLTSSDSASPSLLGICTILVAAQRLASRVTPLPLLVLTCGAYSAVTSPSAADAAHGASWGIARVLRLEHPLVRLLIADTTRCVGVSVLRRLGQQSACARADTRTTSRAQCPAESEVVAASGIEWCSSRLRRRVPDASTGELCGAHAITGGLGGLGLCAAVRLARYGATSVLLTSRSGHVVRSGQGLETLLCRLGRTACVMTANVRTQDLPNSPGHFGSLLTRVPHGLLSDLRLIMLVQRSTRKLAGGRPP